MKTCIIIVNYGTPEDTTECLESLLKLDSKDFTIVIVDVCNLRNSRVLLAGWMEKQGNLRAELIFAESNKGFAGANNLALRKQMAAGNFDFFWLLNNDTVVEPDSLTQLILAWKKLEAKGNNPAFIGSKIIDYRNRLTLQSVGGTFNPKYCYSKLTGMGANITDFPEKGLLATDYVIGASMFFHRSIPEKIGLMDERYFLYYEDIDWCFTAAKEGHSVHTCMDSRVYHKQGLSTGTKYDRSAFQTETFRQLHLSYLKFCRKHFSKKLPVAFFMLVRQMFGKFIRGRTTEARIIGKIIFRGFSIGNQ